MEKSRKKYVKQSYSAARSQRKGFKPGHDRKRRQIDFDATERGLGSKKRSQT